jgi:hypothetical protein
MVVGAHGNLLTVHLVGNSVVKHVADYVKVMTSERLMDKTLCLARAKSGAVGVNEEALVPSVASPFSEIVVNLRRKLLAASHAYHAKFSVL